MRCDEAVISFLLRAACDNGSFLAFNKHHTHTHTHTDRQTACPALCPPTPGLILSTCWSKAAASITTVLSLSLSLYLSVSLALLKGSNSKKIQQTVKQFVRFIDFKNLNTYHLNCERKHLSNTFLKKRTVSLKSRSCSWANHSSFYSGRHFLDFPNYLK